MKSQQTCLNRFKIKWPHKCRWKRMTLWGLCRCKLQDATYENLEFSNDGWLLLRIFLNGSLVFLEYQWEENQESRGHCCYLHPWGHGFNPKLKLHEEWSSQKARSQQMSDDGRINANAKRPEVKTQNCLEKIQLSYNRQNKEFYKITRIITYRG